MTVGGLLLVAVAEGAIFPTWHKPQPSRPLPASWPSATAARTAGCRPEAVLGPNRHTCVVEQVDEMARVATLTVYEKGPGDAFTRRTSLCLPSYHQRARFGYLDLLGNGQRAVVAEFEGNAGTETSQTVLALVVWKDDASRLGLLENIAYKLGGSRERQTLSTSYTFARRGGTPTVRLSYRYRADPTSARGSRQWTETLTWDDATSSFYGSLDRRTAGSDVLRARVAEVRRRAGAVNLGTACDNPGAILQVGVMELLPMMAADGRVSR